MTDGIMVPYKVGIRIKTFEGDWTQEQIDSGEAIQTDEQFSETWYQPGPDGPTEITDPERIAELEAAVAARRD